MFTNITECNIVFCSNATIGTDGDGTSKSPLAKIRLYITTTNCIKSIYQITVMNSNQLFRQELKTHCNSIGALRTKTVSLPHTSQSLYFFPPATHSDHVYYTFINTPSVYTDVFFFYCFPRCIQLVPNISTLYELRVSVCLNK